MIGKQIKLTSLLFLYLFFVVLSFYIENFARFNPFVLLAFTVFSVICLPRINLNNLKLFIVCTFVVVTTDFLYEIRALYTGISIVNIFYIIYTLSLVKNISLTNKEKKQILVFSVILLMSFLVGMLFEPLYSILEDGTSDIEVGQVRYQGLFHASNQSSSVVILALVLFWEVCKDLYINKRNVLLKIILLVLGYFIIYYLQAKTRTLLFALPYFAYQVIKITNFKLLLLFTSIIIAVLLYKIEDIQFNPTIFRLGDDSSSITRGYLYLSEIEKIKEYNILLPKGSHTMTDFVVKLMAEDNYSPHNDFLRYLHDWGFVFILLLIALYKYIKHSLEVFLIMLLYSGCALHNMLFSPYILFLLMLILIVNYKYEDRQYKWYRTIAHS